MPLTDEQLPDFYASLGIPGAVDIHVHFMPEPVLAKVWAYFDAVGPGLWPITYRTDEEARLATLADLGVVAHTALFYPHKPGMAAWLNEWGLEFAGRVPGSVACATLFPEEGVLSYVTRAVERGVRAVKAHLQVGGYDPRDPVLDPVWGLLASAGVPVVCHCGSGPLPGAFTGPGPIGEVLARHPSLTLVIAHCGAPEYAEFLDLAARYDRVHLDTTMSFTDFMEVGFPFPPSLRPRLRDLGDRVVLGSDFPNIPYPYAHQIEALANLELGDDWLRAVLHANGARLLGVSPPSSASR